MPVPTGLGASMEISTHRGMYHELTPRCNSCRDKLNAGTPKQTGPCLDWIHMALIRNGALALYMARWQVAMRCN